VGTTILSALLAAGLGFWGQIAAAAEQETAGTGTDRVQQLEAVTVTAQKIAENVQDVPVSVTTFTEQAITDRQIESVKELADFVPNMSIFNVGVSAMNTPTVRGIYAPLETASVSAGLYIDGVPVLSAIGYDDGLYDVERVEVLRGPQGTLYGKSAEAGVINIVTRQPGNTFTGQVTVEGGALASTGVGSPLKKMASLNFGGPLVKDSLYFGLAAQFYQKDGFVRNSLTGDAADDLEHWSGRAHLRWTPTEALEVALVASAIQYNDKDQDLVLGAVGAEMFGLAQFPHRVVSSNAQGSNGSWSNSQSLKIDYTLSDAFKLTSVTAHRLWKNDLWSDGDCSSQTLAHYSNENRYETLAQELRLSYVNGGIKGLAGLYFDANHSDIELRTVSEWTSMAGQRSRDIDAKTYAAFANLTYPLPFWEQLSLVGGLRYETSPQEFRNRNNGEQAGKTWSALTGKLGLEYRFLPELMAYLSATSGYRSGGFNPMATNAAYYTYDEERLISYELGAKSTFWDNRMTLNGCLFLMDIDNMQVDESVSSAESYLTNAAKGRSMGAEVELKARVTEAVTLFGGYGATDITFTSFQDASGNYKGNTSPFAPQYTFNAGVQYRHKSGIYAQIDAVGYGKMYFDKANTYSRDPYELINAKVGYETEHYDVYLYGKNILDRTYDAKGFYGGYNTVYSPPGEFGVRLTYRF
jgi:iron complex outermembrane receptor protein